MRPEKLKCLLASFIRSRTETDVVDAFVNENGGTIAAEFEEPLPQFGYADNFYGQMTYLSGGYVASTPNAYNNLSAQVSANVTATGQHLVELAAQFSSNLGNRSSITFKKQCIIVPSVEQTISIDVLRSSASADTVTKVIWKTHDRTAISGTHFVGSSGEIVFDQNETEKTINIKILQSSDNAIDLRFNIQLTVIGDDFDPKPMTVELKNIDKFYENEKQVINNFPVEQPFSVEDIRCILGDCLNYRTFHMALTHLCSSADSVHVEFALAFDLTRLCLSRLPKESIFEVLKDFFRNDDIDVDD